jgi:hypothetical protein
MLASLSADVLRSMASASIVGLLEEEEETGQEKTKKLSAPPPMTLSMRRRQAQEQKQEEKDERKLGKRGGRTRDPQKVEYVRGAHEPALVGAISLLLFCAGCLEVFTSAASPAAAAADRGCSDGPGCGGGPAALVVARRLSWLARPWRATGPSLGSLMREEEGRVGSSAAPPVAVEVRSDCRDDDDDGSGGVWTRISPRSRSSRVAAALSSLSHAQEFRHADGVNESQWGGGEENGGGSSSSSSLPPPPWLDHLLYRLVSDPTGPVAASFAPPAWQQRQQQQQPAPAPCAARAVVGGGGGDLGLLLRRGGSRRLLPRGGESREARLGAAGGVRGPFRGRKGGRGRGGASQDIVWRLRQGQGRRRQGRRLQRRPRRRRRRRLYRSQRRGARGRQAGPRRVSGGGSGGSVVEETGMRERETSVMNLFLFIGKKNCLFSLAFLHSQALSFSLLSLSLLGEKPTSLSLSLFLCLSHQSTKKRKQIRKNIQWKCPPEQGGKQKKKNSSLSFFTPPSPTTPRRRPSRSPSSTPRPWPSRPTSSR